MAVAFLSAAGGLLLFYLILDYPRLLARLFSSPVTKKRRHMNNVDTHGDGSPVASVRTLGGEFWSGWFLKAGATERKPSVKTSPMITPNFSISAPFNEKQEYTARTDSLRLPPAIPPHMQVNNRNMNHAQSDETLFSYYGSADSPQPPVPTVPYKPAEARQNQRTLRVITNISEAPAKVPSPPPRSRCLTGNLERMGSNESADSVSTAVSAETPEYKPYEKDRISDMVAPDSAYDNDFKEMNAFPRPQIYAPPPHIAPLFTYVPYLQKVLLWTPLSRYLPHLTFASIILVCVYLFLVLFSTFFKSSVSFDSIGPDVLRSGMIGMMQIPIILGLGGRGSVFRFLLFGRYTGAAMRIHKLAGRLCFFGSAFHTGLWSKCSYPLGLLFFANLDPCSAKMDGCRNTRKGIEGSAYHLRIYRRRSSRLDHPHVTALGPPNGLRVLSNLSHHRSRSIPRRAGFTRSRGSALLLGGRVSLRRGCSHPWDENPNRHR